MIASNEDARKVLFKDFDAWQEKFFAMLGGYGRASTPAERTAIATKFIKEITIPYLDTAKDSLVKAILPAVENLDAELGKLLHVFGEGDA
nr:hypothetical protein [Candidatus Sigynarchaeota archaeon]